MKLSHHHHSGRYLPHHHTSYTALAIVMLCAGLVLATMTANTLAVENPQSGSVSLSGTVPGPPPTQAATILSPIAGTNFTALPITVSGTCTSGLVVQIFKNEVFAGSTVCGDSGGYSLQIDLFVGSNTLVARVYDALDQRGPDSNSVRVTYAPVSQLGNFVSEVTQPLLVRSDPLVRGLSPGIAFKWQFEVTGGKAPYAVNLDWGDGRTELMSLVGPGIATASHTYEISGNHNFIIKVTDSVGNRAYLQAVAIVNGPLNQPDREDRGLALTVAWPLYLAVLAVIVSFWLGEMFSAWRARRRTQMAQPT
jgi:hypothetical protein